MQKKDTPESPLPKAPGGRFPHLYPAAFSTIGNVIFVIGPPGSGKGTLCSRICAEYPRRFKHLSVGDYLRELVGSNASGGASSPPNIPALRPGALRPEEIARYVRESKLLPPNTLIQLIKAKLLAEFTPSDTFWLIDGFPRDEKSAEEFEMHFGAPKGLIQLTCDESIARQRFLDRRRAPSDNEEAFERRLKQHYDSLDWIAIRYCLLEYRMRVNSGVVGWVSQALDAIRQDCAEIVDKPDTAAAREENKL
ncbi:hypothetical protein KVR01_009064 [Diaporthe batatas]|uniref:uncharacterized protein n=1 Tax=Diaporthe batatas TaxID=748121 RepID=UPI001D05B72E|nr:uncharacterized protein KVR01_009064 [Diaporthe batatas]KAG8160800.1 hypothetical protein KVR01_009064 [Diaporthe batatas]